MSTEPAFPPPTDLPTVKLKNGAEEFEPLVKVTMLSIRALMESDPITFYELVMHCRSRAHKGWGDSPAKLVRLGLLQADKQPHDSIRNVVLSAVTGEGLEMSMGDPREPSAAA